ncbi:hypothetical protein B0H19DRAFT_142273 [Mycena capillaripes]|nr:hypothetical protein B0H19DRAFT_142273 [Mycena capillaripes]
MLRLLTGWMRSEEETVINSSPVEDLGSPDWGVMSSHEHLERKMSSLFVSVGSPRENVGRKLSSLWVDVAPHEKLPAELLAEIFVHCTTTIVTLPPKKDQPLLVLTQICSMWRAVALHVPELWASIAVTFTEEQNNVQRITDISQQWLSRAGDTYPLSITGACTGVYVATTCENPDLVAPFVSMVISHAHHLRISALVFPFPALLPLFDLPRGAFPCLEAVALHPLMLQSDMISSESGHAPWHWPSTAVAFESAPLLREVTFTPNAQFKLAELEIGSENVVDQTLQEEVGAGDSFFAPSFSLPWSQLTIMSFQFTALTVGEWCGVLTQCPKLLRFEVAIKPSPSSGDERDSPPQARIQLDCLVFLSISAFSGGGDELIERLVAPNLDLLTLMGSQFTVTAVTDFQTRSAFVLAKLIMAIAIPADDVERLLRHLSDLTWLAIIAVSTDHFPTPIWEGIGCGELLPQLQTLLIRPTAEQAPVLVDMVAERWEAGLAGKVPNFTVAFCDVRPAHESAVNEELRRLENYAEGGHSVLLLTVC